MKNTVWSVSTANGHGYTDGEPRERCSGQRVTDQPKDTTKIEIGAIEKEVTSLPTSRQSSQGNCKTARQAELGKVLAKPRSRNPIYKTLCSVWDWVVVCRTLLC